MSAKKRKNAKAKPTEKKAGKLTKKQLKKQAKKQEKAIRKAAKKLAKSLSRNGGKKAGSASVRHDAAAKVGKATKAAGFREGSRAVDAVSFGLNLGSCPCCGKHCPLAKPKCGKGRAVARKKRARLSGDIAA